MALRKLGTIISAGVPVRVFGIGVGEIQLPEDVSGVRVGIAIQLEGQDRPLVFPFEPDEALEVADGLREAVAVVRRKRAAGTN